MRHRPVLLLGLVPLAIALFVLHTSWSMAAAPLPQEPVKVKLQDAWRPKGEFKPKALQVDPEFIKQLQTLREHDPLRIDTARFALNVVQPKGRSSAEDLMDIANAIPKGKNEFFTAFQNDDGTGRATTLIVSSDEEVDAAHKALLGRFTELLRLRGEQREALRKRIYLLGLCIVVLAALGTFFTAVFGSKGTRTVVITVSMLTLCTSVLGFISKDRSEYFGDLTRNIEEIQQLRGKYYQHRTEDAAVPKRMLAYIEDIGTELQDKEHW